jgi:protein-L-isoaspartate(D-aspartate) O-methyltransferase
MNKFELLRQQMIDNQLLARGLKDPVVLKAINAVPREQFIPTSLVEFAYQDRPLPIEASQTISQPYIVALMVAASKLKPEDKVLEIGTGSGYAAAVLAEITEQVFTVERHKILADTSSKRLSELGYNSIKVLHGDGTLGWPEYAPFDAIIVAAGGPDVPNNLKQQLAIGGRLVIPIGSSLRTQKLMRITRINENEYQKEDLGDVRFVPLIGAAGWKDETAKKRSRPDKVTSLTDLIYQSSEHFASIDDAKLDGLMDRIGDSRLVLLGESSHGTSEFYDMRAKITQELIEQKGFNIIAVEANWPDAAHINNFIQGLDPKPMQQNKPFSRFPTWMWANKSVLNFSKWLKTKNSSITKSENKIGFYGLDLYSLYSSIEEVLNYLEKVDPETAKRAKNRYGCLLPWVNHLGEYGQMSINQAYRGCEDEVLAILDELLNKRLKYIKADKEQYFNAEQNARVITSAERYYRTMYYAENNSWNQRDQHMFECLESILEHRGKNAKAAIWAHNSHLGDARATQMSARGELNLGQLVREIYEEESYSIGFGTDHGTVAAASDWDGPMEIKQVQPAHIDSYEHVFHAVNTDNLLLPLKNPLIQATREKLLSERLERAIGVIYRPETELQSHYFYASLPQQFDEYIWFDETHAVEPISLFRNANIADTFPFGL